MLLCVLVINFLHWNKIVWRSNQSERILLLTPAGVSKSGSLCTTKCSLKMPSRSLKSRLGKQGVTFRNTICPIRFLGPVSDTNTTNVSSTFPTLVGRQVTSTSAFSPGRTVFLEFFTAKMPHDMGGPSFTTLKIVTITFTPC